MLRSHGKGTGKQQHQLLIDAADLQTYLVRKTNLSVLNAVLPLQLSEKVYFDLYLLQSHYILLI